MLPKKHRLSAKEFPLLYKKGFKSKGEYVMLVCLENNTSSTLFGFVVSKKIGNSVKRHRMTRLLRAISMEGFIRSLSGGDSNRDHDEARCR